MDNSLVSLFAPSGGGATDMPYALQLATAQRQQRLADMLRQQSAEPIAVQSGGGAPAPISWGSVLAKALQGVGSSMREGQAQNDLKHAGDQDNASAQALAKQLTQGAPQLQQQGAPAMPASTAAVDMNTTPIPGQPAPQQQSVQQVPIAATSGQGPQLGMAPQSSQQQMAALLAAHGGPQTQMIQNAMLPQILNRQNMDYQHQLGREDKVFDNTLPMSTAIGQQIAAQGQQTQANAAAQNALPMTADQKATNALGYAQLNKPIATSYGGQLYDPKTGKVMSVGSGTSTPIPTGKDGLPVSGDAYLSALPQNIQGMVKAIAEYRQAPLTATALRSPQGAAIAEAVNGYNPQYDATQYGSKVKARNDFATGKNGNTVRSLNVAVQHLDQLGALSEALGNGDTQAVNRIGQFLQSQTGAPAPTNFNAAKQLVGDEIVKAIVGAGGGTGDREEAAKNISLANSPQQLAGVIKTYKGLMGGQLAGLRQQYQKNTGLDDFDRFLAPSTQAELATHAVASGAAMPPPVSGIPQGWTVRQK